jgi:hypothetical protein
MPDTATSPIYSFISTTTSPVTTRSKASEHAKFIITGNTHSAATVNHIALVSPTGPTLPRSLTTYRSTGVQTLPPPDATSFYQIHGRDPTHEELERKIGLAAYGRYMKKPRSNPHEVVYGTAFRPEMIEHEFTYADVGFQTLDFAPRKKALAKAKVKASMIANKYKRLAAEDGYTIWAEPKDDKTIHSEQYAAMIKLDSEGNAKDGEDLTGRFLPNIWKEERRPEIQCHNTAQGREICSPEKSLARPSAPSRSFTPLSTPSDAGRTHDGRMLYQIITVEPSLRETTENAPVNEKSYNVEDSHTSSNPYNLDPNNYVVYDAGRSSVIPPARTLCTAFGPSRKRKDGSQHVHNDDNRASKRLRTSRTNDRTCKSNFKWDNEMRLHEVRPHSRECSPSHPEDSSSRRPTRPLPAYKQETQFRETPDLGDDVRTSRCQLPSAVECEKYPNSSKKDPNDTCRLCDQSESPESGSKLHSVSPRGTDDTLPSRRRSRSSTRSEAETGGRKARGREYKMQYSTRKDESKEKIYGHGFLSANQIPEVHKQSVVDDNHTHEDSAMSMITTEHSQTQPDTRLTSHPKSHRLEFQQPTTQVDIGASRPKRDTPRSHHHTQREELRRFIPRGKEIHEPRAMTKTEAQVQENGRTHQAGNQWREAYIEREEETRIAQLVSEYLIEETKPIEIKETTEPPKKNSSGGFRKRKRKKEAEPRESKTQRKRMEILSYHSLKDKQKTEEVEQSDRAPDIKRKERIEDVQQRKIHKAVDQDRKIADFEQRNISTYVRAAELRPNRATRADMQRYIPRALRHNTQAYAVPANSSKDTKNKSPECTGNEKNGRRGWRG